MSTEPVENPISAPINDLLIIFKEDLAALSFPDINNDILQSLASDVISKSKELEEILATEEKAREALEESQNELFQRSIRALAYAKIYAEDREEVLEKLASISFGKSIKAPKKSSEKSKTPSVDSGDEIAKEEKKSKKSKSAKEEIGDENVEASAETE